MDPKQIKFAFWGTSEFSVYILETLKEHGFLPSLIISTPDKPQGRKLLVKPTLTKIWAEENDVKIFQPAKLDEEFYHSLLTTDYSLFVVASYGKIIPERFLDIPKHKTLNVHPSLLPNLRGPSPIETAILLDQKNTGVSIMRLDKEMDHGPIIAQKNYQIEKWPSKEELEKIFGKIGGELLAEILPKWINGEIYEKEQDHSIATYCKKIEKQEALVDLSDDPYLNFRKIKAYSGWPNAFFFEKRNDKEIRVVIKKADYIDGKLIIQRVVPEGKKEMDYQDFVRGELGRKK